MYILTFTCCDEHGNIAETFYTWKHFVLPEPVAGEPDYHPGARQFDRNLFDMERTRQEVGPAVPPPDTIIDSLAQEWSDKDYLEPGREEMGEGGRGRIGSESMWSRSAHGSSVSIPSEFASIWI